MLREVKFTVLNGDNTAFITTTLRDKRGWGKNITFTHTPTDPDVFIVFLTDMVIQQTFGGEFAGLNVCQMTQPGIIAINHQNWVRPPEAYDPDHMDDTLRLEAYRTYVLQHEMGHFLGISGHAKPVRDKDCPVMYQQTKGTGDTICDASPWPQQHERGRAEMNHANPSYVPTSVFHMAREAMHRSAWELGTCQACGTANQDVVCHECEATNGPLLWLPTKPTTQAAELRRLGTGSGNRTYATRTRSQHNASTAAPPLRRSTRKRGPPRRPLGGGGGTSPAGHTARVVERVLGADTTHILRQLFGTSLDLALERIWVAHGRDMARVAHAHLALVVGRAQRLAGGADGDGGVPEFPGFPVFTDIIFDDHGGGQVDWTTQIQAMARKIIGALDTNTILTLKTLYPDKFLYPALLHAWDSNGRSVDHLRAVVQNMGGIRVRHNVDPRVLPIPVYGPFGRTTMSKARDALAMRVLRDEYVTQYGNDPAPEQLRLNENSVLLSGFRRK